MDVESNHDESMDEDHEEDGYSGDEEVADGRVAGSGKYPMWLPPGADCSGDDATFASNFEEHFNVPERLADKSASVVEAVNDFHFAMINDHARNCFYRSALQRAITPGDIVLEIGTGSGLLAMLAARAGAGHVYAIEANRNMADLAVQLIKANGLDSKITVINALSTHVKVGRDIPRRADVLVSEIFGTMLLGESALTFISHCRDDLLKKDAKIVPGAGCQFISLIESADIKSITSASNWGGINLEGFDALQDTCNVVFTKQYGFRLSSVPYQNIAQRIPVADVNFCTDYPSSIPNERRIVVKAERAGTIHAVMAYWEAYTTPDSPRSDPAEVMSTDPEATRDNFPRDMQWGQAIQLVEDVSAHKAGASTRPVPLVVAAGDALEILARFSSDRNVMQFEVNKLES
eukprot:m.262924 g.262924  ORF g.262924 m.262924 type:complete len:405 (+) comp19703_c0_seq1:72-1286(+)